MRRLGYTAALIGLATAVIACDPTVELPDGSFTLLRDAGLDPPPAAPLVTPPPPNTPYDLLTLRGTAQGRRVIISGTWTDAADKVHSLNPEAVTLGIGGQFCADLRLPEQAVYSFQVQAYGADNQVGAPLAEPIRVRYDQAAPALPSEMTCAGVRTQGCAGTVEICDDDRDNDCNGLVDEDDPVCRTCTDDLFEPNNGPDAPRIQPGVYTQMQICPGNPDYYGVYLSEGERLLVQATFTHAEGDLDLDLIGVDQETVLTRSATTEGTETVNWTATANGVHVVRVYGNQTTANGYILRVEIFDN